MGLLSVRLAPAAAADWQTDDWHLVPATNSAEKRPAPIRNIARTAAGTLLGTRSAGSSIELWSSANNGVDWSHVSNVAESSSVVYGDPTLTVLDNGDVLAAYREEDPALGWSVRVSRSVDDGQSWTFGGTIHDWTGSASEFVGAPQFNVLSDGTLQSYYDSEFAAPSGNQYIAVKDGAWNADANVWEWSNERVVNTAAIGGAGVRDGLATIVNLGPDADGVGDRLMVVTEAVAVTGGRGYNLVRAFEVENSGATQADWNNLLDSRIIYQSPLTDPAGHRYNAYAPYALRVGNGPVVVAFSTDEVLHEQGLPADLSSAPPDARHSEIKLIHTTNNFESWSAPITLWGVDHPEFSGSATAGDIFNYQIGLFELSPNDVLATLDLFGGKQIVLRPSLGGDTADFDESGAVDGGDFLIWQRGYGLAGQTSTATGDATGEGLVDGADLTRWAMQFGATAAAAQAAAVPELPSGTLAVLAALTAAAVPTGRPCSASRP